MDVKEQLTQIDYFESHYKYDGTYVRDMLESSHDAYSKFTAFKPMSTHREKLSVDAYWVTKLAAVQVEDCGSCLQLNIRMALEAGVSKSTILAIIDGGVDLSDDLKVLYTFAKSVAANTFEDSNIREHISSRYNKGELLEIGMCISAARVFPTIKRAAGYSKSCSLMDVEV